MNIDKQAVATKLLWVDLEMTGLDPNEHVILEVAAIVTDFDFKTLTEYRAIIRHEESVLKKANEWAAAQHTQSGLLQRVRTEGRPDSEVQAELAAFITAAFGDEPAVLAGNSIHNDRIFIKTWWPQVDDRLHYRMLDVSSLKILMQAKYGVGFAKKDNHRAEDDIQASIAELRYYLEWLCEQGK